MFSYIRVYYRISIYLQALMCTLSKVIGIACLIDVRYKKRGLLGKTIAEMM
jgi:hypothetical protein